MWCKPHGEPPGGKRPLSHRKNDPAWDLVEPVGCSRYRARACWRPKRLPLQEGGERRWYHGSKPSVLWMRGFLSFPGGRDSASPAPEEPETVATPVNVGIMMSRIRIEEKLLMEELHQRGANIIKFDDRELFFDLNRPSIACDVVLERCINHLRALYSLRILNDWGVPTVNTWEVANNCG